MFRLPGEKARGGDGLRALAERVSALEEQVQRLVDRLGEQPAPPPEPTPDPEPPYSASPPAAPTSRRLVEVLHHRRPSFAVPERAGWDWARIERMLGRQWMTWAGVLALFLATGFFVKYAMERGWLGPTARWSRAGQWSPAVTSACAGGSPRWGRA